MEQEGTYRRLEPAIVDLDSIKIHPEMSKRPPRSETLDAAVDYLRDTGRLKNLPTVDKDMNLLDGYANYLAAAKAGMARIKVRVDPDGTARVIEAVSDGHSGEPGRWTVGRDLEGQDLKPGDALAVILDGKARRAVFTRYVDVPRIDAVGMTRAIRRWSSRGPKQA